MRLRGCTFRRAVTASRSRSKPQRAAVTVAAITTATPSPNEAASPRQHRTIRTPARSANRSPVQSVSGGSTSSQRSITRLRSESLLTLLASLMSFGMLLQVPVDLLSQLELIFGFCDTDLRRVLAVIAESKANSSRTIYYVLPRVRVIGHRSDHT